MQRRILVFLTILFLSAAVHSQSFVGDYIFSIDFGYLGTSLKNNGWGLGLTYEHAIGEYFSFKGGFSHMTVYPSDLDFGITTVGIKSGGLFYPFGRGLDKLYLGVDGGTDFIMHLGKRNTENEKSASEAIITICPQAGWKQNFLNYVMLDAYVGYRILLNSPDTFSYGVKLVNQGFEYGIKCKINIPKVIKFFKNLKDQKS